MICDKCKFLELKKDYKIICKLNEHQLLDVKQCQNFKKAEDE
ncbi:hypothetical protein [Methanobrevibacter sp.]